MRVAVLSIVFMTISALISIGLPIALFVVFRKKYKAPALPLVFGIAGFVIFALVLERSIHSLVFAKFALRETPLAYILYGIFMAGIFEETARFISFTLLKKRCTGIGTALAYGVGHGGIEAVLLAGLAMVNSVITSVMINAGQIETITGALGGELLEQANIQIAALASSAPYLFLVGGIERLFALGVQIALSVIVFYAVYGKNKTWLFPLAILIHAVIDIPAAALQVGLLQNILLVEVLVGVSAVLLVLAAKYAHEKNK